MDKRAAAQYLNKVFGTREGYVSVAYKDQGDSWQECQFQWPQDKAKIVGWAFVHQDANIFICPALRQDSSTRKKGDAQPTSWLWADVDWDKVPEEKRGVVKDRIDSLGTYVVASGTGDNSHVYVKLEQEVGVGDHYRLNAGLRDYLYADAKHADNSLLRLPGTINWKTKHGQPVKVMGGTGKGVNQAVLMKHREFRNVKVTELIEASAEWNPAEVEDLPRRILRMVQMHSDEAVAKYGSRHKAVWAVTGELHKRGLDSDTIHTLMDAFPAAVEKNAEEHNGYDVHKDVEKRLIWDRAHAPDTGQDDEAVEDAGDVFESLTPEEVMDSLIQEGVEKELLRRSIRKAADRAESERGWTGPPDDVSWSLTDGLSNPPAPMPYLIGPHSDERLGLAGARHNVVITAQYKTGKTAFTMGAIAASLCDGTDFLDHYPVNVPSGGAKVGHWNCEMDPTEMLDDYMRPVGIKNTDNLHVVNLRGHSVNILTSVGKAWAVKWLSDRAVKVWTIDSFARLARMANVSEKDNDEVMSLLMALDEIKVEAGVEALFLITHTGRTEMEEGKERARGATAIDDWADARWILTKMDKVRFLAVEGRGVALDTRALLWNEDTKRSTLGFGGKSEVREDTAKDMVVGVVNQQPGLTKTELKGILKGKGLSSRVADGPIEEAIEGGFIELKTDRTGGGRPTQRHYPAGTLKGSTRHHGATPGVVDLRGGTRRRRVTQ